MTRSESITHLAAALAKAQAEMPVAVFDATNPFLKSRYASLGAVLEASRPILAKRKLSLVQFPVSDAAGIGVESILTHESGEFIAERIVIALTEEKGKSRVQAAGSTLTYLRRHSWASILGMNSDEDSDGSSPVQAFAPRTAPALPPVPMAPRSAGRDAPATVAGRDACATTPPATMEEAWAALNEAQTGQPVEVIEKLWFDTIARLFPNKSNTDLKPHEWGKLKAELADYMPM